MSGTHSHTNVEAKMWEERGDYEYFFRDTFLSDQSENGYETTMFSKRFPKSLLQGVDFIRVYTYRIMGFDLHKTLC